MKTYINPEKENWSALTERPSMEQSILEESVRTIMQDIERNGDSALLRYTKLFDGCTLDALHVTNAEIDAAIVSPELKVAIDQAYNNIESFHNSQVQEIEKIETTPGVVCWRKSVGIEKVGLYIPGGSAPLFSTILMLGIPAKIAGCREIVLCTTARYKGRDSPGYFIHSKARRNNKNI